MNITFMTTDRKTILELPIVPDGIEFPSEFYQETMSTIQNGDITLIGNKQLLNVQISSFFPSVRNKYPYQKKGTRTGMQMLDVILSWQKAKKPVRMVVVSQNKTIVNVLVILNIVFKMEKNSDIAYNLTITEYVEGAV